MNQTQFAAALLDPSVPQPAELLRPNGLPATRRFAVYRNNVAVGLTGALQIAFPVIRKLVGEEFFSAMAGEFLRRHPPQSRIMMLYGAEFPGFLAGFAPVAHLAYLPDVARLEQALRESYHAADPAPLGAGAFTALDEASLRAARFTLAASVRLIRSPWPIHAIWQANTTGTVTIPPNGQDVVVLRPDFDPQPHLLPTGGGPFLAGLLAGQTLDNAIAAAGPDLDLSAMLTLLVTSRSLTGIAP